MTSIPSPFEIQSCPIDGYMKPDFFQSLRFDVEVVIDVGVSKGTPWLYESFPDKEFFLVDPLPDFQKGLSAPPTHYRAFNIGMGAQPGKLTLDLRGPRSSLHSWDKKSKHASEGTVEVKIDTLDNLIEKHARDKRIGLKVDTEGHEVDVISGLSKFHKNVEFIVCECSVRKRFDDDYSFSDLIICLKNIGFEFYNFISLQHPRPVHYDCIFLKKEDRRFSLGKF